MREETTVGIGRDDAIKLDCARRRKFGSVALGTETEVF
jgi:hypothetical protein